MAEPARHNPRNPLGVSDVKRTDGNTRHVTAPRQTRGGGGRSDANAPATSNSNTAPTTPYMNTSGQIAANNDLPPRQTLQSTDRNKVAEFANYNDRYRQTLDQKPKNTRSNSTTTATQTQDTRTRYQQQYQNQRAANKNQAPTKVKVTKKRKLGFIKRVMVYSIITGFYAAQVWFGVTLVVALGIAGAVGSVSWIEAAVDGTLEFLFGANMRYIFSGLWFLMIGIGILKLLTVGLVLSQIGAKPLGGKGVTTKYALCITAFVLYSFPVSNLFPWSMIWAWYVMRHPD